jgi:hypothetical protein
MTQIDITKRRSNLINTNEGIDFIIPTEKYWWLILFAGCWMYGSPFLETTYKFKEILSKNNGFAFLGFEHSMIVWIVIWTIFGFFVVFALLWTFLGKEHIILHTDALIIKREIFSVGWTRKYEIANIHNLCVDSSDINPSNVTKFLQLWGFDIGLVAFDYGEKTYRCGNGIDESEASDIVKQLQTRYNFNNNSNAG